MRRWAEAWPGKASDESFKRLVAIQKNLNLMDDPEELRTALLDFIADFSNWDNSRDEDYLETARALTQAAHEALGGEPGTRPMVIDPFAGGGSIPLEALRVGADVFASDLNPVAVLLNKAVLEYIPKYGRRLADEVRRWGLSIREQARTEIGRFYPEDSDGSAPIAYLWARTIRCEGPGCGAEVPMVRSLWLARKGKQSVALKLVPNRPENRVDLEIVTDVKARNVGEGTVRRGSVTCPACGFTTPVAAVRRQLKDRRGGAADALLLAVVTSCEGEPGRSYRPATENDRNVVARASVVLAGLERSAITGLAAVPDETLDLRGIRHTWIMIYGIEKWGDLFMPRQAVALATLSRLVTEVPLEDLDQYDNGLSSAVRTFLAFAVDRQADYASTICRWVPGGEFFGNTFSRQAVPFVSDFAESVPFSDGTGGWMSALEWVAKVIEANAISVAGRAEVTQCDAGSQTLPDDAADAFLTDPPYYDAVPYAYLSDFFYCWLKRSVGKIHPTLFADAVVPKDAEIVVDRPHELSNSTKDIRFYEKAMGRAFSEGRRALRPSGIGTVVFASKTTASWEAILQALVDAGWSITASWPIDSERAARIAAQGQARLGSSVHIVCRPRENPDGSARTSVGEWRDVIGELPGRIHDWLPRLAKEGVVGADAIFACIGPALEIFSRYSRVEKVSGETVPLGEYLEQVWAAVAKEAMSVVFEGADATGFEPDARLTAMWLWTLSGVKDSPEPGVQKAKSALRGQESDVDGADAEGEEDEAGGRKPKISGYVLEFDAARKIAQGLGAHLEKTTTVVEVKGETARLLPVAERAAFLFESAAKQAEESRRAKPKKPKQLGLFAAPEPAEAGGQEFGDLSGLKGAATVLDRLHQAMLLFGAGRGEAMKRFLVEEGAGADPRLWKLAQALSALYPAGSEEKRWVDGVLGRKKGLGF